MLLSSLFPERIEAADDPELAAVIVDDIVDSGRTQEVWRQRYPDKPFFSLHLKDDPSQWVVFPWEKQEGCDGSLSSGMDIATRLLEYIGEDPKREGLLKTPERFAKAWQHWTSGYKQDPAEILHSFADGAEKYDEMILLRDVPLWSFCEHHLAPFFGVAHVAYVPNDRIVGLSKVSRLVSIYSHRLQVQERLTNQVADALQNGLEPKGVAVLIECRHTCMESRGIHQAGITTSTCALRGVFKDDAKAREEFLSGARGK